MFKVQKGFSFFQFFWQWRSSCYKKIIKSSIAMIDLNQYNRVNGVTNVGAGYLCQSIRGLTSLKHLSLSLNDFLTDARMTELCAALKTLSSLQTISLNFEWFSSFKSKVNWFIHRCEFTDEGLCELSQTLKTLSSLRNVQIKFDE